MKMFAYKTGKDNFIFFGSIKREVEYHVANSKIPSESGTIVQVEIKESDKDMRRFKAILKKYKRVERTVKEALKDMHEVVEAYKRLPSQ